MSSSSTEPSGGTLLPAPGRLALARQALFSTRPGRLLILGVLVKVAAALIRWTAGAEPSVLAFSDTLGSIAVIAALGYFLYRLIQRARRRLLWRVRRKLILSYIFIGVVPAFLIVAFFVVSGLILFLNVASFLVQNGFANVTSEAVYLARVTALEIQRGPGPQAAAAILKERQAALAARYPGASMAFVLTAKGDDPCVGGPTAGPQVPPLSAASRHVLASTPLGTAAVAAQVTPASAGPWEHIPVPSRLPTWVSCAGFGGIVVEPLAESPKPAGATDRTAPALIIVRGVGLPDTEAPSYAVVVDIPKNDGLDEHLRDETSIKIGDASVVLDDSLRTHFQRPLLPGHKSVAGSTSTGRRPSVAFLQGTDWANGNLDNVTVSIQVNFADIYDRLSTAPLGSASLGSRLMIVLLVLAVLLLIIEAAALVMGLALARSITGSVHELFAGTERVRMGDFSHRIEVKTRDQLGELADSFNQMTGSIEELLRQAEEKKRLEEELRIAREIQMSLLPRGQVSIPGLSLSALCVPAREVGGDYYDFLPLGDNRLGILIADVSGKGTSAALYMAELKGLILSLSRIHQSPRDLMLVANDIISRNLDSRSFITMSYAVLDLDAHVMTFARAGHTPLIYRTGCGTAEPTVEILTPDGLVLGLRIDGGELFSRLLQESTIPLSRGDVFVFFTDGISEAMNAESDLFGEARLAKLVAEHGHLPASELRERVLREIESFVAGAAQHDDMTMILLKIDDFVADAIKTGFADGEA
ncbi:MAG TPA: SpoIIE family protein phosphatase [Vicinamibacterales bacterium]|jgi:serine phosphatase RsbU (regulator of sigma subunit)